MPKINEKFSPKSENLDYEDLKEELCIPQTVIIVSREVKTFTKTLVAF